MAFSYLFDKVEELKEKFNNFFSQRKKLKALENLSEVIPFKHNNYLKLIRNCMDEGFLDNKEADFLDHILDKYEVNFLDWAHKTKWLKGEMARMSRESFIQKEKQEKQMSFLDPSFNIPLHLLNSQTNQRTGRRI